MQVCGLVGRERPSCTMSRKIKCVSWKLIMSIGLSLTIDLVMILLRGTIGS
jgi:hypothetical protein